MKVILILERAGVQGVIHVKGAVDVWLLRIADQHGAAQGRFTVR